MQIHRCIYTCTVVQISISTRSRGHRRACPLPLPPRSVIEDPFTPLSLELNRITSTSSFISKPHLNWPACWSIDFTILILTVHRIGTWSCQRIQTSLRHSSHQAQCPSSKQQSLETGSRSHIFPEFSSSEVCRIHSTATLLRPFR